MNTRMREPSLLLFPSYSVFSIVVDEIEPDLLWSFQRSNLGRTLKKNRLPDSSKMGVSLMAHLYRHNREFITDAVTTWCEGSSPDSSGKYMWSFDGRSLEKSDSQVMSRYFDDWLWFRYEDPVKVGVAAGLSHEVSEVLSSGAFVGDPFLALTVVGFDVSLEEAVNLQNVYELSGFKNPYKALPLNRLMRMKEKVQDHGGDATNLLSWYFFLWATQTLSTLDWESFSDVLASGVNPADACVAAYSIDSNPLPEVVKDVIGLLAQGVSVADIKDTVSVLENAL